MSRARSHQRIFGLLSLGLIGLVAELAGRSLTHRLDVGRQVGRVSYAHAEYYPFLLAGVKIGVALMLAGIAWRFAKARAAGRAAHRVAVALGASPKRRAPRVRIELSPRLWLISFVGTASIYLIQADAESAGEVGRWTVLSPWLHSSALPVFAVLAVLVAVALPRGRRLAQRLREPRGRGRRVRAPAHRAGSSARSAVPQLRLAGASLPVRSLVRIPPAAASGLVAGARPRRS